VHESAESLVVYVCGSRYEHMMESGYPAALVAGMYEADRFTIHLSYETIRTYDEKEMLDVLLHEIGHAWHGQKYGTDSLQFSSEERANAFSRRWLKRIWPRVRAS
jgi:hypothetical protein